MSKLKGIKELSDEEKKTRHEETHKITWQFMTGKPTCPICGKPLKSAPMTQEDIDNF